MAIDTATWTERQAAKRARLTEAIEEKRAAHEAHTIAADRFHRLTTELAAELYDGGHPAHAASWDSHDDPRLKAAIIGHPRYIAAEQELQELWRRVNNACAAAELAAVDARMLLD